MNFKAEISFDQLHKLARGVPIVIRIPINVIPKPDSPEYVLVTLTREHVGTGKTLKVEYTQTSDSRPDMFDRLCARMDKVFDRLDHLFD